MNEAMGAEFDTVAAWTAEVALDLGPEHYLPAGCRGSGNLAVLRWFLDRLAVDARDRMLDCGAGVGGPAGFAARETGVVPVLTDPEPGACWAARRLFGLPVVRAATALPFSAGAFDVAWSLGVLCTVLDQPRFLAELRRALAPDGRLGLLVFVATRPLSRPPSGNTFPTEDRLHSLLTDARLAVRESATTGELGGTPPDWQQRTDAVEAELERRHGTDPAWQAAAAQSARIGELLADGSLVGTMLSVARGERTARRN